MSLFHQYLNHMRLNALMSPLSLIHSKRPSAVDNVLESYTMFCVDFMGLPGFHTSASIPLHNFFKWLTQLLQTTKLITSFRKAGGRPDREPAAIKTSGTGPHSHRTFYCCNITVGTGIGPKMFCSVLLSFIAMSLVSCTQHRTQKSLAVCADNTASIFKKADETEKTT